jgi:hypothetical protein
MKKFAILSMTILFAFSVTYAQPKNSEKGKGLGSTPEAVANKVPLKKLEGSMVSQNAKNSFIADFGNIPEVQWKRTDTFDEAAFTKDNRNLIAYYDDGGNLVGTTEPKTFSDLPEKARKSINEKYKDFKIGNVIFFDDNDRNDTEMVLWSTQFQDEDLYFVELERGTNKIIVRVSPAGYVSLFKQL